MTVAAQQLEDWRKLALAPASYAPGFAAEALPPGATIRAALDEWAEARNALPRLWTCIPEEERIGLLPPPQQP